MQRLDGDTETFVVAEWPAEVASTLNAQYGDKQGIEDQHAMNGAPLFVPAGVMAMDWTQNGATPLEECSPSLRVGACIGLESSPMVADVTQVRRLTPTECERLQGYEDGWTEGQSDSVRYRQLGNSVAVPCVEWIARRMVAVSTEASA